MNESNEHMIKWNYRVGCPLKAVPVDISNVVIITKKSIFIKDSCYSTFHKTVLSAFKGAPDYIKKKVKEVYKDSKGYILLVYDDNTVFLCGCSKMIGTLHLNQNSP
jgi:hypothetical protein